MRIGLYVSVPSGEDIDTAIRRFALAESAGFATAWTGQRARGAPPG